MTDHDDAAPRVNALGQPIGPEVSGWSAPPRPPRTPLQGRWCELAPLEPDVHARELYDGFQLDEERRCWTYLGYGPFESFETYRSWLVAECTGDDPMFFAIRDKDSGQWGGVASYLRIEPPAGSIEVGHICYSPRLQQRRSGTEAMYLMMKQVFDLGYRRYEWKCDALNASSKRAAERYGFEAEGVFRQAVMYKGRNRDTAWYSVLDREWPELRAEFERWLASDNFDAQGVQKSALRVRG